MDDGLFPPLGASATRCGVYYCTLLVDEHERPAEPDDEVTHYNEDDRVGWLAPMPEEWR